MPTSESAAGTRLEKLLELHGTSFVGKLDHYIDVPWTAGCSVMRLTGVMLREPPCDVAGDPSVVPGWGGVILQDADEPAR